MGAVRTGAKVLGFSRAASPLRAEHLADPVTIARRAPEIVSRARERPGRRECAETCTIRLLIRLAHLQVQKCINASFSAWRYHTCRETYDATAAQVLAALLIALAVQRPILTSHQRVPLSLRSRKFFAPDSCPFGLYPGISHCVESSSQSPIWRPRV